MRNPTKTDRRVLGYGLRITDYAQSSVRERPQNQRCVVAAEAEGVGHGGADGDAAGGVGDVVEIALGVRVLVVDGGGDDAIADRLDAEDGLDGAGGAKEVAGHRLGRADGDTVGVVAKE